MALLEYPKIMKIIKKVIYYFIGIFVIGFVIYVVMPKPLYQPAAWGVTADGGYKQYQFSSYLDFLKNDRPQKEILNRKAFPNYFPTTKSIREEIFNWLALKEDDKP